MTTKECLRRNKKNKRKCVKTPSDKLNVNVATNIRNKKRSERVCDKPSGKR